MGGDDVLGALELALRTTPRTGTATALVHLAALSGRSDDATAMAGHIAEALRGNDVVDATADRVSVLLRGVQDLRNAQEVARRICAVALATGPACVGVTLLNVGESMASVALRAEGALDLALSGGSATVVSSPPLPA